MELVELERQRKKDMTAGLLLLPFLQLHGMLLPHIDYRAHGIIETKIVLAICCCSLLLQDAK